MPSTVQQPFSINPNCHPTTLDVKPRESKSMPINTKRFLPVHKPTHCFSSILDAVLTAQKFIIYWSSNITLFYQTIIFFSKEQYTIRQISMIFNNLLFYFLQSTNFLFLLFFISIIIIFKGSIDIHLTPQLRNRGSFN